MKDTIVCRCVEPFRSYALTTDNGSAKYGQNLRFFPAKFLRRADLLKDGWDPLSRNLGPKPTIQPIKKKSTAQKHKPFQEFCAVNFTLVCLATSRWLSLITVGFPLSSRRSYELGLVPTFKANLQARSREFLSWGSKTCNTFFTRLKHKTRAIRGTLALELSRRICEWLAGHSCRGSRVWVFGRGVAVYASPKSLHFLLRAIVSRTCIGAHRLAGSCTGT